MKRLISFVLTMCMIAGIAGCSEGKRVTESVPDDDYIVDASGLTLKIPEKREETTIASVYAVAVPFIVALGLSDRTLAINVKSVFWTDADDNLAAAGTVGRGTVDLEALAALAPGVLIHRANDNATIEAVTGKLGIEVMCIRVEDFEDIKYTLGMMGRYFGCEERAEEVIGWLEGKFALIDEIVAEIPEDERVTALVMGGEVGRVAGGDMLQSWMIEKAGGICVSSGVSENRGWVNVGVETVFEWNPEFLFCTGSTMRDYTDVSMMDDSAWSAVSAVKNGRIFVIPSRIDAWDMPGISCALGTMYMLYRMYPEKFSAERLQSEIDEYYEFMFDRTFDNEYLGYDLEN